jgi:hypothetical protein
MQPIPTGNAAPLDLFRVSRSGSASHHGFRQPHAEIANLSVAQEPISLELPLPNGRSTSAASIGEPAYDVMRILLRNRQPIASERSHHGIGRAEASS